MQLLKSFLLIVILIVSRITCVNLSAQSGVLNRVMKKVTLVEKSTIPIDFSAGLPIWYGGDVYCVNFNSQSIVVLDAQKYEVKRQIGRAGNGPGEFKVITGYSVDKSGISVIDGGRLTITEFDLQGKMTRLYKHPKQMMNAIRLSEPYTYIIKPIKPLEESKEEFQIVNIDKQTIQSVYAVTALFAKNSDAIHESLQTIFFEGQMVRSVSGYVFRVPWLCGEFLAFDEKTGRVLYGRETIDKTTIKGDPPSSTGREGDNKTYTYSLGSMRRVNLGAAANSQYLFVLSNAASPSVKDFKQNWTDERIVDAYKIKNGDYAFSFVMPKHNGRRATEFSMTEDTFCVLYEDEIVRYAFQLP